MTAQELTVTVRMYNPGFGDMFVVTVQGGSKRWRAVVDCGVHSSGQARPLKDTVEQLVEDLRAGQAPAHVDVVIATHHHADHIAGFALDLWEQVEVGEVWVPFVEDPQDADAQMLRQSQARAAEKLLTLIGQRTSSLAAGAWPMSLETAQWFAANSRGNDAAADRLLGRNGQRFANTPPVRFLPSTVPGDNVIPTGVADVTVHVLGPPRDAESLKRMRPPARAGWLALDYDFELTSTGPGPLFAPAYVMDEGELAEPYYSHLNPDHKALKHLGEVNDDGLLAAASVLERSVNNTSLFFVLDVAGLHLVFPGDAQEGAWRHVLEEETSRLLVSDAVFYKVSHHGSHNGTPKRYIEEVLKTTAYAMLPWGSVTRWNKTIPKAELLEAMSAHGHHLIRSNSPTAEPGRINVHGDVWSEVVFSTP
ncbi:MAG TPA: MBL fold metallo-hydrolase [Jatrophihabitans sp.]|jgi:beta-lactamase superfamily II metal-dependent hydrolase